jgi:hypothetical protein
MVMPPHVGRGDALDLAASAGTMKARGTRRGHEGRAGIARGQRELANTVERVDLEGNFFGAPDFASRLLVCGDCPGRVAVPEVDTALDHQSVSAGADHAARLPPGTGCGQIRPGRVVEPELVLGDSQQEIC